VLDIGLGKKARPRGLEGRPRGLMVCPDAGNEAEQAEAATAAWRTAVADHLGFDPYADEADE